MPHIEDGDMGERFTIMKKVGSGSFGVVYKCRCRLTGEVVAIKQFLQVPRVEQIAKREISLLKVTLISFCHLIVDLSLRRKSLDMKM